MIVPLALLADISSRLTRKYYIAGTCELAADCFPQKDNAARRIFRDAKLSTAVLTGTKRSPKDRTMPTIRVRVYPWNSFNDAPREAMVSMADLSLFDPENLPVPMVSEDQLALARKLHRPSHARRLGEAAEIEVTRGEINQTIYRDYITSNPRHRRLVKGVEIGRYRENQTLKQGKREWLDEVAFLKDNGVRPVIRHRRIATQRITGVDERWRLVATIIPAGCYFADSTNSIVVHSDDMRLEYLLGLLNSRLWQWRFKLTSSNNNVGTNEVQSMPLPRDLASHDTLVALVERMLKLQMDLSAAKSPRAQTHYQRDIVATDRAIDQIIYQLYDLTPEEIALVEAATAPAATPPATEQEDPRAPNPTPTAPAPNYTQAEAEAAHHYFVKEEGLNQ